MLLLLLMLLLNAVDSVLRLKTYFDGMLAAKYIFSMANKETNYGHKFDITGFVLSCVC